MPKLILSDTDKPIELLDFLQQKFPVAPASYWRKLLRSGKITVNRMATTKPCRLQPGETVELPESSRLHELIELQKKQPEILYESREILILHKPAGLACHSSRGHEQDNLTKRVSNLLLQRKESFKTAPCHRLDLQTSGPVIFGKGKKALTQLGILMQSGQITKRYLALVPDGIPGAGRLRGQLPCKGKEKQVETLYKTIGCASATCLLELELRTGRQHQIRRQLADLGFPIFGDSRYRGGQLPDLDRMFLHCHRLSLRSPFNDEVITLDDPLPAPLQRVLDRLGIDSRQQLDNSAAKS